jgi:cob(I)alamin adenosyltransferase
MKITTKTGDQGKTALLHGDRVPKYHPAIEAVGVLDEANAFLSLAGAASTGRCIKNLIGVIQKHLSTLGAELVLLNGDGKPLEVRISEKEVLWLEWTLEKHGAAMEQPAGFLEFGESQGPACLNVARTIIRRLERRVVWLSECKMIDNPFALKYLNRLSDLLFVLACVESEEEKQHHTFPYQVYSR